MIDYWFSDPSGGKLTENKFSSYYHYDPQTKTLVRIRLELGRQGRRKGVGGETKTMLSRPQYVGFSEQEIMNNKSSYKVINGKIVVDGERTLRIDHEVGDFICDMVPNVEPHFGNKITDKPNLPDGIKLEHLQLIANDVMLTGQDIKFTANDATPEKLSKALKEKVSEVMGNKAFNKITDEEITAKVKSQKIKIAKITMEYSMVDLNDNLSKSYSELYSLKVKNGFTPDSKFNEAYRNLYRANKAAYKATARNDIAKAQRQLVEARRSMEIAYANAEQEQLTSVRKYLEESYLILSRAINDTETITDTKVKSENEVDVEL